MVVGFRVYRYDSVLRSIVSWGYNRIVRVLFRVRVRDVDCSFKLMRAEVRDKLPLQTSDFFIDTEIVACARRWNFRIAQKGVRHYPRVARETTVQPSDVLRTLGTIATMWRRIYMPSRRQRSEADEIAQRVIATEHLPTAARNRCARTSTPSTLASRTGTGGSSGGAGSSSPMLADCSLGPTGRGPRRILDLGCGTGAMLAHLRQFGEAEGVDADKRAVEFCPGSGGGSGAATRGPGAPVPR